MKWLLPARVSNKQGSSVVDYLMLTVVISAVAVPILYNNFGEPFVRTLQAERGKLVNFIGQTPSRRKPPVPAEWFSQERPARPDSKDLGSGTGNGDLAINDIEVNDIEGGKEIKTGNLSEGSRSAQDLKEPGAINVGANGGAGGAGGNYAGVGSQGGSSGMAGGDDFFSSPPETPGKKGVMGGDEVIGGGGSKGNRSGETSVAEREESMAGEKKAGPGGGKEERSGESRLVEGKNRTLVDAEERVEAQERKSKFDWWMIIKVLLVLFIIALLFMILLGNTKRSG